MLQINTEILAQALQRTLPGLPRDAAMKRADDLIRNTDQRLEANVLQWIHGDPIEDLWIGEYCINSILAIRKSRDFLYALEAMNLYLQDPAAGELRIWRARR